MNNSPKKVLVVDDERPMAKSLELKLAHAGFLVTVAHNGIEALDVLKSLEFDVILMDLIMPKLDGFGLLEQLKTRGNKTPIIVMSNLGQEEDKGKVLEMGASLYLVKSDTQISHIIEEVVHLCGER
jgi:DNA-binding response OmpR family regulator